MNTFAVWGVTEGETIFLGIHDDQSQIFIEALDEWEIVVIRRTQEPAFPFKVEKNFLDSDDENIRNLMRQGR